MGMEWEMGCGPVLGWESLSIGRPHCRFINGRRIDASMHHRRKIDNIKIDEDLSVDPCLNLDGAGRG